MPLSDTFLRLPLSSIFIDRASRQRRVVASEALLSSIRQRGVMNPIIVTSDAPDGFQYTLVAGEGRLDASRQLDLPDIPARLSSDLSEVELQIIELEENIKRTELSWQDRVSAAQRIHQIYCRSDEGWTMTETAEAIGLSLGTLSMYLRVGEALLEERIATSDTVREAYNKLARQEAREAGEALEELLTTPVTQRSNFSVIEGGGGGPPTAVAAPLPEVVLNTSFLEWAPHYSGQKFNLIHCDFPYGTSAMQGPQATGGEDSIYSDSPEVYFALLDTFVDNWSRFASISAHLLFWSSSRIFDPTSIYSKETWQRLSKLPMVWWPHPLIWTKSDNAGIAADPRRGPRHIYEVCLFGSSADRQIVKIVGDSYQSPSDRSLHPSAKPEPMLRHFFQMVVDSTTKMLDPTCGAGSSLRAADSLNASVVLGLEIDEGYAKIARREFKNAKMLRNAAKFVDGGQQ